MKLKEFLALVFAALLITVTGVSFFYIRAEQTVIYDYFKGELKKGLVKFSVFSAETYGNKLSAYNQGISYLKKDIFPPPPSSVSSLNEEKFIAKNSYKGKRADETGAYFDKKRGLTILTGGKNDIVYYNQKDDRWKSKIYGGGSDDIGHYACGPTAVSMVVSSLTKIRLDPVSASDWAANNGYHCEGSGSYHTIISGIEDFGLKVTPMQNYSTDAIKNELNNGKVIVALMHRGHFASEGHFLILRGVTQNGEILIADPQSYENSVKSWDANLFTDEAKYGAGGGGPFWSIEKK